MPDAHCLPSRHNGHELESSNSHGSTQVWWNLCLPSQGSTRRSSPSSKSTIQMGHVSRPMVWGVTSGFWRLACVPLLERTALCSWPSALLSALVSRLDLLGGKLSSAALHPEPSESLDGLGVSTTSQFVSPTPRASASFVGRTSSSCRLNLTIGNVSKTALAKPLARLWGYMVSSGLVGSTPRGPYRSGCRNARTA